MNPKDFSGSVLVVDDEPFVLRTTAQVLSRLGFTHVHAANSVEEAMAFIVSSQPPVGLVLTDLNMPEADGLDLLRQFDETGYSGAVVLFSGEDNQTLTMAESLARARKLSVLGAIEKPIQAERLLELLTNHTGQTRLAKKTFGAVSITPEMLEQAIDSGEIKPWFQPKIRIADRLPVGVEALARWPDSAIGPVFPDIFIPVAEKHGLIDRLTFSIIAQAAQTEQQWRQQGISLKVAVNLSMDSLYDENFPDRLEKAVMNAGGDIGQMQLEVTESRLMEDLVRPLEALLRLRMKKVRLSIDDFGTGHSNLSQLRDLPFDELKLDRSFVQPSNDGGRTGVILESSVEMARKLNMTVVAEGVETLDEWLRVERLGCDQVQGYFTARPMPGDEIPEWIKGWPQLSTSLFSREASP